MKLEMNFVNIHLAIVHYLNRPGRKSQRYELHFFLSVFVVNHEQSPKERMPVYIESHTMVQLHEKSILLYVNNQRPVENILTTSSRWPTAQMVQVGLEVICEGVHAWKSKNHSRLLKLQKMLKLLFAYHKSFLTFEARKCQIRISIIFQSIGQSKSKKTTQIFSEFGECLASMIFFWQTGNGPSRHRPYSSK